MGQDERCSGVNWEYIFVSPVDYILVFLGVLKAGVYGLQVLCAGSLQPSQDEPGCQLVGIAARTEACDDKQRTDNFEEYLTVEREPASIVADRRGNVQLGGGCKTKISLNIL